MTGETWAFVKGHGTENDFIVLLDEEGNLDLSPSLVAALCDRRRGLGADGILRAVRAGATGDGAEFASDAWFMDLRNADGSTAEMSGNGIRVFAAFLARDLGVDFGRGVGIATRAGLKTVTATGGGRYSVGMGRYSIPGGGQSDLTVAVEGVGERPAVAVDVGNPHAVVAVTEPELERADLTIQPRVSPEPEHGANVELVAVSDSDQGDRRTIRMRVYERGVGETRSCGTGACASSAAARSWAGESAPREWEVRVPGGTLSVVVEEDGLTLVGPAVLVADGLVDLRSLLPAS
jgi:diaminopimelate epimerase